MGVYVIAEAGVNHNGSLDLAIKLCNEAKNAGADAVKFQTWKTELVITKGTSKAEYQSRNIGGQGDQFEMLKKLELSYNDFIKIKEHCDRIGIQFLSTADENESLDFLLNLGIPIIKLGSGELTNIPFLHYVGSKGKPVILSTGMAYLGDVERALKILYAEGADDVTLLHCTTNYPCPMNEVNLRAMITLRDAFKCKVGYSDHTMGIEIPIAAVALGAEVIEKHFTLDRNMEGPDHEASINPVELKQMIVSIRNIESALGNGIKQPNESEIKISTVVTKRIVAQKNIQPGDVLDSYNICVKRANSGLPSYMWDLIIGRPATKEYRIDQPIVL